jgi:hypothetical protein
VDGYQYGVIEKKSLGVSDTSKATAPLSFQAMDGESEALIEGREAA